jgi:general secretion pathway protein M
VLRQQVPVSPDQAAQSLQSLSASLGSNTPINRQGASVTVNFKAASPAALAEFLTQARAQAHAQVSQAHWQQSDGAWSGQLVLQLPNPR